MKSMVTYTKHGGASVASLVDSLTELYAVVYAEPPYGEGPEEAERFRIRFAEDAGRPGFALVAAGEGETLVGAAYGWTMGAGEWWSRADRAAPDGVAGADKVAVMEWIVRPGHRGEGTGAELIRQLLGGRPEPFATLASDPRSAARGMYERAGWVQVARSELPWGASMDLLVLDLRGGR